MILDLINYSLDQNNLEYSIEEIDSQLLKLNIKNKKFIVYYNDIASSGSGRNRDEVRIQLSVSIKHKLIGFSAEDMNIVLLGYDNKTNTFSFWKYSDDIDTNTKQSLYTRKKIIEEAKIKGLSKYYIKKRDAFNRRFDQKSISLTCNAFLFPLIIKYYSKIFERDFLNDFQNNIKRFNYPYSRDDLLLCLNLYFKERKTKNIEKNHPDLKEANRLCIMRFKTMGFTPLKDFVPDNVVEKYRNTNGIYTKIQNFKDTDPNVEGGYPGGARRAQEKIWNFYFQNGVNNNNKKKMFSDAEDLIQRILSKNIEILIGKKEILKIEEKKIINDDIFTSNQTIPDILEFTIDKEYKNRVINPDNFSNKIEALNQIDKANEIHEKTVNDLAKIFKNKKLPIMNTKHIDFYSEYKGIGKLFEIKTFTNSNFNQQIRHGISQLREYYFLYAQYWKKIPANTDLFLLLNKNPQNLIKDIQLDFLKDQKITICWIEDNNIVSLNNKILF